MLEIRAPAHPFGMCKCFVTKVLLSGAIHLSGVNMGLFSSRTFLQRESLLGNDCPCSSPGSQGFQQSSWQTTTVP